MKQILLFFALLLPVSLSAQLIECFDGPQIDTHYPWQGDLDRFVINENKELQLSDYRERSSTALLYIESSRIQDNEWSFRARIEQKSTAKNYLKVYLWSKETNMNDPGEALFVRLGYSGNNISLCYQSRNLKPEELIRGRTLFDAPSEVEVRVVIDKKGFCTLYSKAQGETEFYKEGTTNILLPDQDGFFMLGAVYTQQFIANKYFDDIYIRNHSTNAVQPGDPTANLKLIRIEQESETSLLLYFNKEVFLYSNYYFSISGIGEIEDVYYGADDENPSLYHTFLKLELPKPLKKGKEYDLTFWEIYDSDGMECIESHTFTSKYGEESTIPENPNPPSRSSYGDVIINEIMADPKGLTGLPATEYVELYNTTDKALPMKGWSFIYSDKYTELDNISIPAKGYAILYRAGRDIRIEGNAVGMPLAKFPAQLANDGRSLRLEDASGTIIDEVIYAKATAGKSWERSDEGWHLSSNENGGTPGTINSKPSDPVDPEKPTEPEKPEKPEKPQIPDELMPDEGEIVFNELLPNPYPDGSEYIELYNRSDRVLSFAGLSIAIRKSDGSLSTKYPLSSIEKQVEDGAYVVLTKDIEGVRSFYTIQSPGNLYELKLPVLANTSSHLVLFRTHDSAVIDEIQYSSKWHSPSIKNEKGVALERIDADGETQDPLNWLSASEAAGYGTPGYRNSQTAAKGNEGPDGISIPEYSDLTGLYRILYALDKPGYTCRMRVFDLSGRLVKELANHQLLGASGEISWDGLSTSGVPLKTGLYIFHAVLYHPGGGESMNYKKVFLIK